jgi:hypothetical protein
MVPADPRRIPSSFGPLAADGKTMVLRTSAVYPRTESLKAQPARVAAATYDGARPETFQQAAKDVCDAPELASLGAQLVCQEVLELLAKEPLYTEFGVDRADVVMLQRWQVPLVRLDRAGGPPPSGYALFVDLDNVRARAHLVAQ